MSPATSELATDNVLPELSTRWLGKNYRFEAEVDSTNTLLSRAARTGAPHGAVIVADAQTAGRGRLQRSWHSPPGNNLDFSLLLRLDCDPRIVPLLSLAAGVAVAEAVAGFLDEPPELKWPNDVLHGGQKLAGILAESSTRRGAVEFVVLGVGLNVNQAEFPEELQPVASSLRLVTGRPQPRQAVLLELLLQLEGWVDRLQNSGAESILPAWKTYANCWGQTLRVSQGKEAWWGTAVDLDGQGRLILEDEQGQLRPVLFGDAVPRDQVEAFDRAQEPR